MIHFYCAVKKKPDFPYGGRCDKNEKQFIIKKSKMKTKKTIYHLIVDKSGSMSDCIDRTIEGFNEQLKNICLLANKYPEQDIAIGLTMFNDRVQPLFYETAPEIVKPLTVRSYWTEGCTALLDAIGETVTTLQQAQVRSEQFIPTTVVIVILTDGHENSSSKYRLQDIRRMISGLEETGKWTFSFIGATLDAVHVAEQMAIKRSNSVQFDKSEMKSKVWDRLGIAMDSYMEKKDKGQDLGDFIEK
jgi:hypothetical protein